MTHGTQVVNFGGLRFGNNSDEVGCITQIPIVQKELDSGLVTVTVNVVNTTSIEARGTSDNSMDLETLLLISSNKKRVRMSKWNWKILCWDKMQKQITKYFSTIHRSRGSSPNKERRRQNR